MIGTTETEESFTESQYNLEIINISRDGKDSLSQS